jgi:hypothetical protein
VHIENVAGVSLTTEGTTKEENPRREQDIAEEQPLKQ